MHLKTFPGTILALLFVSSVFPLFAQVVPSARQKALPFSIGGGVSRFNPDYAHGAVYGGTLWFDYTPYRMPQILRGLGVEAEARDLSLNHSSSQPPNLRLDVASGGAIYARRLTNFRLYAKALYGLGNIDYEANAGVRVHDSTTVTTGGGGIEVRAYKNLWVRGDYEYQFWPDFYKTRTPAGNLTPQGATLGAVYDFSIRHLH
jgi:hypothetical protein